MCKEPFHHLLLKDDSFLGFSELLMLATSSFLPIGEFYIIARLIHYSNDGLIYDLLVALCDTFVFPDHSLFPL